MRFSVRASTSVSVLPCAKLSSLMCSSELNTRGAVSDIGGFLSGRILGATSHRKSMPKEPAISTGSVKSNIPNLGCPRSAAIPTARRFVDVPMVVAIPPISVARPMGISVPDGAVPVRIHTATSMGNNMTTMGVLFRKALQIAPTRSVTRSASFGRSIHAPAMSVASGCSAPVDSMPLPTTSNAQIVTSASWPKWLKKSVGWIRAPLGDS